MHLVLLYGLHLYCFNSLLLHILLKPLQNTLGLLVVFFSSVEGRAFRNGVIERFQGYLSTQQPESRRKPKKKTKPVEWLFVPPAISIIITLISKVRSLVGVAGGHGNSKRERERGIWAEKETGRSATAGDNRGSKTPTQTT